MRFGTIIFINIIAITEESERSSVKSEQVQALELVKKKMSSSSSSSSKKKKKKKLKKKQQKNEQ